MEFRNNYVQLYNEYIHYNNKKSQDINVFKETRTQTQVLKMWNFQHEHKTM